MSRNGNSKVAVAMTLGMVFGGYLALSDRAERQVVTVPAANAVTQMPEPEAELLPPVVDLQDAVAPIGDLIARNNWHDLDNAVSGL